MATIRIYKVAGVLGIPSQEIIDLLRREHGIEIKSASSTIEEIVAKQFAERIARERDIELPSGQLFGSTLAQRTGKRAKAVKAAPPKPVKPKLGPPRLVKAAKAAKAVAEAEAAQAASQQTEEVADTVEAVATAAEVAPAATLVEAEKLTDVGPIKEAPPAAAARVNATIVEAAQKEPEPPPTEKAPAAPIAKPSQRSSSIPSPTGRVVPPTLRLRVEDPRKRSTQIPGAPGTPGAPRSTPAHPGMSPPAMTRPPLGGPRPLPSQPVRPPSARPLPPRPAVGYRPPPRPYRPVGRRSDRRQRTQAQIEPVPVPLPPVTRVVTLPEGLTVKDLAEKLEVKVKDVLKKFIEKHLMMTINTTLPTETATMIAREFGADVKMRTFEEEIIKIESEETKSEDLVPRGPVVTVMGHVDHGKTTLLDAFRQAKVAEGEAGGITQHIGAYVVDVKGQGIVFLDTPGHEAFTMMRARGAKVTDIVVLVVAADDGVMPQTQEAIDHAKSAGVPILVAINKIDKADANPDRVKKELAERDLTPEDWGGNTIMVSVSAKTQENLDALLEMILLVTELGEHKANPKRLATGTVLEAKVDRGRGPMATILVQDGMLGIGDNFIAGTIVGRVRALIDDRGNQVKRVGPSSPVEVIGLTGLPQPGDAFQAVTDAAKARQIALFRLNQAKEKALGDRGSRLTLESLQQQLSEGSAKELPVIIKADVQGSAEVLADLLSKLGDERVEIRIIHTGVGAVSEWDVLLASTSNAIIIGFNVRPDRNAAIVAEQEGVDIRKHSVIYNVADEVKKAMAGLLEPTTSEQQLGLAEVRELFKIPKFGTAAGCMVTEGRITRAGDAQVRLVRDGVIIHEGRIGSLRRFKDDVSEVTSGIECGIAFERFADLKLGDVIESFSVEKVAATV